MSERGQLEWLDEADSLEKRSRRTRVKDSLSSLLEQYAELLRCGQMKDVVTQQVNAFRTSVLATSLVQEADALVKLADSLRRESTIGDQDRIQEQGAVVIDACNQCSYKSEERLETVRQSMSKWLHELETHYYSSACKIFP